jgi:hypothetical protein
MRKIFVIFCLILCSLVIQAQTMEMGLFGGGSYYLGDLNPGMHFMMIKPAYGIVARYNYGTRWAFKAEGFRGKVAGNDAVSKANVIRGVNFESKITDISVSAEFNFFDYFTGSKKDVLTPYIFGGFGFMTLKVTVSVCGILAPKGRKPASTGGNRIKNTVSPSLSASV